VKTNRKTERMPTGYGLIQRRVMRLPGLSIQAKGLFSLLCSYTGAVNDNCFPSQYTMAVDLNVQIKSIRRWTKELISFELLEVEKFYGKDSKRNNLRYFPCIILDDVPEEVGSSMDPVENTRSTGGPMVGTPMGGGGSTGGPHNSNSNININNNNWYTEKLKIKIQEEVKKKYNRLPAEHKSAGMRQIIFQRILKEYSIKNTHGNSEMVG